MQILVVVVVKERRRLLAEVEKGFVGRAFRNESAGVEGQPKGVEWNGQFLPRKQSRFIFLRQNVGGGNAKAMGDGIQHEQRSCLFFLMGITEETQTIMDVSNREMIGIPQKYAAMKRRTRRCIFQKKRMVGRHVLTVPETATGL